MAGMLSAWVARNGVPLAIRPIRPDDEARMVRFHHSLSDRSVYLRYFHFLHLDARTAHDRLAQVCHVDYAHERVLVAQSTAESGDSDIVAVGRLTRGESMDDAEFALLVSDAWQDRGIGSELLHRLVQLAREVGIRRVVGDILSENQGMQDVCRALGFQLKYSLEDRVIKATLLLEPTR
jgi:acetyltransferase